MNAPHLKSNSTKQWQDKDSAHLLHPFMSHPDLRKKGARIVTGAEGVYIFDSEGNKILDGMAGLWCTQIGYGNEELVEAATNAMRQLPYYNLFFMTSQPYAIELAAKIAEKAPGNIDQVHFATSGSEAVDTAYKLIKYYWNLKGQPQRKQFISRDRAYHGSTTVAASLCGLTGMHPQFDLPIEGIHHVSPAPYYFENGGDLTPEEFTDVCVKAIEDKILEVGPENVAAFVGEPVMGAGGMIPPPPGYWKKVEAVCRKYGIIMWCDEVICGWGRTGEWFGSQYFDIEPDIITMAKGLSSGYQPISAVAMGGDLAKTIRDGDEEMVHGFTYSGHPVACAVALKNIEIMERDNLIGEGAKDRIDYFQEQLASLSDHPIVGETRGLGFLGAIELVKDKKTKERFEVEGSDAGFICREHCFNNGLVMRSVGNTMILSPPIIITKDEIDELVTKARRALDLTAKDLGVL
ncbi:aspartate aminotransferase family protein [Kordiimonas sediminis]|uniref:Aspartate aminotransferase family protein n=1 Tax=Kordiimonas sediminis TaxID=1735581 RepID=A0A919E907_9PROT|nr:aminotransferase [Kordiimonas sediminis]GHF26145.1 aspartate aminotransferase family protein [Kordiimonas sediminis]